MTNRRSLKVADTRYSRALQFVPGHVGGRVDSAQPVRRRSMVGMVQKQPGDAPTSIITSADRGAFTTANPTAVVSLPTPPAGMTSAVLLIGSSGYSGPVIPSGWRLLTSGSFGTRNIYGGAIDAYALCALDSAAGNHGLTYSFSSIAAQQEFYTASHAVAYFTGGTGGTWGHIVGEFRDSYSDAPITAPPASSAVYVQLGIPTGVYSNITYPTYTLLSRGIGAGAYIIPGGTNTVMPYETPPTGLVNWDGIGAYGMPNSVNFAAFWSP